MAPGCSHEPDRPGASKSDETVYRTKAIVPCACRAVTNDERPVASGESITAFAGAYPTIESLQSQV
ncbi:hypothetical protein E5D57_008180 [Metarhizium anisopliae]|nr:hypothetical protein E5D57_008180 [Metarhizium anisopliae]